MPRSASHLLRARLAPALAVGALLSGCAGDLPPPAPASEIAAVSSGYLLGPGDQVRIEVFGEEDISTEYTVSATGDISFPLVGSIPAAGMTISQVAEELRTRLAQGYINEPRISAEVLNYRPFYILGEVTRPGAYPYTSGLTASQAVALAGGFTYRAQQDRVVIKRATNDAEYTYELDGTVPVLPGDTIRVPERFF